MEESEERIMRVIGPHYCLFCDFAHENGTIFAKHFEEEHQAAVFTRTLKPTPFDHERVHLNYTHPECHECQTHNFEATIKKLREELEFRRDDSAAVDLAEEVVELQSRNAALVEALKWIRDHSYEFTPYSKMIADKAAAALVQEEGK